MLCLPASLGRGELPAKEGVLVIERLVGGSSMPRQQCSAVQVRKLVPGGGLGACHRPGG